MAARAQSRLDALVVVLVLGVLCSGMAYFLYFRLIAQLGPARAITVTFLLPVFALLYGTTLLDEPLTLWMLGCGAVVVLGTALSSGVLRLPARRAQVPGLTGPYNPAWYWREPAPGYLRQNSGTNSTMTASNSSRPINMPSEPTQVWKSLRTPKFADGPTWPSPGPMLLTVATTARTP